MFVLISMSINKNQQTNDHEEQDETESLVTTTRRGNYLYNPSSQAADRPSLFHRQTSSTETTHTRRESTLHIPFSMMSLTTTATMASIAQDEASHELQINASDIPPLGLVLTSIPTIDTSLSALGQPIEEGINEIPEKSIFSSVLVWTFFLSICLYGVAHSMISQFLFLLLTDVGMSSFLIGCTGALGGIAEVFTFWFSKQVYTYYICSIHITT